MSVRDPKVYQSLSKAEKCRVRATRHGLADTPTHRSWMSMRQRCLNQNDRAYRNYGGRGITICSRWSVFENFLADMGVKPDGMELERINVDGNYEPGNCRWATISEQARNTRRNRFIEFNGKRQTVAEWSRELGILEFTIYWRLNKGWSPERALSPVRKKR